MTAKLRYHYREREDNGETSASASVDVPVTEPNQFQLAEGAATAEQPSLAANQFVTYVEVILE